MEKPRILSGEELVSRGTTKSDGALPELGLKDVVPNGSWLEQKQVQSALEARKHLIEVERIEKSGSLSHAEWHEDLMLAEVTQKVGGHWQYMGHNVGKQLYLYPEEALFLIELNALQLTYNKVTVSLQQAYSLLLRSNTSLVQYQVYSSLSRVGYKVFRHDPPERKAETVTLESDKVEKDETTIEEPETVTLESDKVEKDETTIEEPETVTLESDKVEKDETTIEEPEMVTLESDKVEKDETTIEEPETVTLESHKVEKDETTIEEPETVTLESHKVEKDETTIEEPETVTLESDKVEKDETTIEDTSNKSDKETESETTAISEGNTTNENYAKVEMMDTDIKSCDTDLKAESCDNNIAELSISKETNTNGFTSKRVKPMETDFVDSTCEVYPKQVNQFRDDATNTSVAFTLQKLESRQLKISDPKEIEKHFQLVPDMFQKQIVTVKIPQEELIPKNVFLNNTSYVLNVESIRSKRRSETSHGTGNHLDEVNGSHIKRVRETSRSPNLQNNWPPNIFNMRFAPQFRPFFPQFRSFVPPFFPPPLNFTNVNHWNSFLNLVQRFTLYQRPPPPLQRFPNLATTNVDAVTSTTNETQANQSTRKRSRDNSKKIHMDAIKKLADRLKSIIQSGSYQKENIIALQRLINTYNIRYHTKLRLTEEFEICNNETIVDTIELDDEEETVAKKPKDSKDVSYDDNLSRIKKLATELKQLETKNKATARHRRVLSALVKKFNKSYSADITLKNNEIVDKSLISLDSSSESDCVVQDTKTVVYTITSGKKLKNPFSILKRLSEKRNVPTNIPGAAACDGGDNKNSNHLTFSEEIAERVTQINNNINLDSNTIGSSDEFKKQFGSWLPPDNDFGTAEVPPRNSLYNFILDHKRDEYIFEFIKNHSSDYANWLELKIGYLKAIKAAEKRFSSNIIEPAPLEMDESDLKPIIGPEDGTEIPALLNKLSIIKTCTETSDESPLKIDFDVYNRDVQNFRKTNRLTPHFKVICVSESSSFPPGRDIVTLHSLYNDGVTILFAAVGVGSVSFLQANPACVPVYVPTQE